MARKLKLLAGLSTLAATGALALSGCAKSGSEGEGAEGEGAAKGGATAQSAPASSGGGGGEGDEGAKAAGADKASFISQLMILRGHLKVGAMLYEAGDAGAAKIHMKHPHDELYASLMPMFEAYGAKGVDAELSDLASAVENGASANDVGAKFSSVSAAVQRAIDASAPTLKEKLLAASKTLRQAGSEFEEGVKNGAVVNAKEYQDAYGFCSTVVEMLGGVEGADPTEKDAVAIAREQAALALAAAPTAEAPARVGSEASTLFGAAARIEIAALGLK